jgi:hypothetical protein
MVAMSKVMDTLQFFLPPQGKIANFAVGLLATLLGAKTLYDAFKGRWYPGHRGSHGRQIKAEWYHRAIMILFALGAIYFGWIFFLRSGDYAPGDGMTGHPDFKGTLCSQASIPTMRPFA